jgi:hypothetical protein
LHKQPKNSLQKSARDAAKDAPKDAVKTTSLSATGENAVSSEQHEFGRHSFVIKLWLEEGKDSAGHEKWRGHITYVYSEERRFVERLAGITEFIERHLAAAGAATDESAEKGQAAESGS